MWNDLPEELADEIIQLAASPELQGVDVFKSDSGCRPYYSTAISLARVSHAIRTMTMPHLLRTVILHREQDHIAFTNALSFQQHLKLNSERDPSCYPRLLVDYERLVHRLWSSQCLWHQVNGPPGTQLNFDILSKLVLKATSLGLNIASSNMLEGVTLVTEKWSCRHITLAGSFIRWNPFVNTCEGLALLNGITHLTLWITVNCDPDASDESQDRVIPPLTKDIPFTCMPNLTYFACTLLRRCNDPNIELVPTEMLIYDNATQAEIKKWVSSCNPLAHGTIVPMPAETPNLASTDLYWERLYLQGKFSKWKGGI